MLLALKNFSGEIPKLVHAQLPDGNAQYALNCDFTSGILRGIRDMSLTMSAPNSPVLGMYTTANGNTYSWAHDVDVIRGPVAEDVDERFYWTDGSAMWVSMGTVGGGWQPPAPNTTWRAGVPNPTQAPVYNKATAGYPSGVTGYTVVATCTKNGVASTLASTTTETTLGRVYSVLLSGACAVDTSATAPQKYLVGTAMGTGDTTISGDVYAASQATNPLTGSVYVTLPNMAMNPTSIALSVTNPTLGTSVIRNFNRIGITNEYCTTANATSLADAVSATNTATLSFELQIRNTDGVYGAGDWKVTVPLSGSASLPSDIGGGFWSVSAKQDVTNPLRYTFTISPGNFVDTRAYVYTYVNLWGEESGPSPATIVDATPGIGVSLNLLYQASGKTDSTQPNYLTADYRPIDTIRLYRSNTGSQSTSYQFVADFTPSALGQYITVVDTVASSALGEIMQTLGYAPPPSNLSGLTLMANGIAVAFVGDEVWFSEPYMPAVMKPNNVLTFANASVKGLCALDQSLLVTTTSSPWMVSGITPDGMTQQILPEIQPGIGKNSIARMGRFIAYLSWEGIVVAQGMDTSVGASLNLFTRNTWQDRYKANLPYARLTGYDGALICTFSNGATGFILRLDETSGTFTQFDTVAQATMVWPEENTLFISQGPNIYAMGGSLDTKPWAWWSKDFLLPKKHNFGSCQVLGTGDVTVKFYCDRVLKYIKVLTGMVGNPVTFRLPSGFVATRWSVEVLGSVNGTVNYINLATDIGELQSV